METVANEDSRGFDPLEFPSDREVVPAKYPRAGNIGGRQTLADTPSDDVDPDSVMIPLEKLNLQIDTVNSQAFRVQISTSKLFSESKLVRIVAEEIFDQPVYVDYEVPYFKVRVGSFADRDAAEKYQQKAKAVGYSNAWVVMVNLGVKEAAPLYDDLYEIDQFKIDAPVAGDDEDDDEN